METIQRWVDGKIDFQSQRLADRIMQEGLVAGASVAFLLGYLTQNMQLCMVTFGFATLLVALVTVPPWPKLFNRYHVEWLPNTSSTAAATEDQAESSSNTTAATTGKGGKKTITVKTSITTQVG
ncbi:related to SPC1 - signal peptidase 10.8 kDa subunit [Ustilago trichophora]|uniref:Signal peptidase complex subunit 1 n=1 Tax=Ustilago trichophora TaxID=86804 RepID=A0A5C3DXS0_9BASI|nr:related to SPC1 - signal peptidase 10.8 kDa subunit [Ustilago trichophora]